MVVSEIFHSIQGEGPFQGLPTVFVRFTGCDLRCSWCDTAYAFHGGRPMSQPEILAAVAAYPTRRLCLTGGEPLLQKELPALARALLDEGWGVSVETGGHRTLADLPTGVTRVVDVKCPGSGAGGSFLEENLALLRPGDELKFVVADWGDLAFAVAFCRERTIPGGVICRVSPAWGALDLPELARRILDSGQDLALGLQLHKQIWGAEARGV
jgi:7-carboxy-7-deazaguanine synthase